MTEWYFYLNKGKATGPMDRAEVRDAIARGQIGPFDLLYRDGQDRWQPIHEFSEFRAEFKERPRQNTEDSWVVLLRTETKRGLAYLQRGPFSTKEIQGQLKSGEIQYRDFIWREGQEEWSRISKLELFNPPPLKWEPATKLPHDVDLDETTGGGNTDEITAEHEIAEVITQTRFELPKEELPPKEAVTPDLTNLPRAKVTAESHTRAESNAIPETASQARTTPRSPTHQSATLGRRRSLERSTKPWLVDGPRPKRLPMMRWAAGVVSAALIAFLYFHVQDIMKAAGYKAPKETKKEIAAPPAPEPPKVTVVPKPVAPPPEPKVVAPPPEPEIPKVTPTRMNMQVIGGDRPSAVFTTDGSNHFPIKVTVIGPAGDVLEQVSVFREVNVRWENGQAPRLDLFAMGLGEGRYLIQARQGEALRDQGVFRLGKDNREFRAKMERHRKLISLPYQRERRRLILASVELARIASSLRQVTNAPSISREKLKRLRTSLGEWAKDELAGIDPDDPKSLVFPLQWQTLNDARKEMNEMAVEMERSGTRGKRVDQLKTTTADLERLAEVNQGLSLYK